MKSSYGSYLQQRDNGRFYFLFTVPQSQRERFGGKAQIRKSLKTRDRGVAMVRVGPLIQQYQAMRDTSETGLTYDGMKETARTHGFGYHPAQDVQAATIQDSIAMLSQVLTTRDLIAKPNPTERAAMGGAIEVPPFPVSKLFDRFKEINPGLVVNKTPSKEAKAWQRYKSKIDGFIKMMGDLDCLTFTKKLINEYRNKLILRVKKGDFLSAAANEYLEKIRTAWRKVIEFDYADLNLIDPFDKVEGIDFGDAKKREDFTNEETAKIRSLLETSDVDPELKALMLIAQNTGCGADELVYMTPDDFALDHEIPHLKLRPNIHRKELKNHHRPRNLPLIGVALEQARLHPNGFPKYCTPNGPNDVSEHSAVYIKKVAPTKSFTSYRHRIVTLLRNSDCKDQFQDAICGHATTGITGYYGGPVWLTKVKKALTEALPEDA